MLISAEFATANIPMNGKMRSKGSPGAPARTTWVRAEPLVESVRSPNGTRVTAQIETRT